MHPIRRSSGVALALALCLGCAHDTPPESDPVASAPGEGEAADPGVGRFEVTPTRAAPRPTRLAVADGAIFLSDVTAGRVTGVRDGEVFLSLVELDRPVGLAVHGDSLLVGSTGRGAVDVYSISGRAHLQSLGGGAGAFEFPNAIAVASDGTIHVADSKANAVQVFTAEGAPLHSIGGLGDGAEQLRFPSAVAVDADHVYVGDQGNHRVQVYDRGGAWVRSLGGSVPMAAQSVGQIAGRFTRVQGLAIRGARLYVLDAFHAHVQVLDLQGTSLGFVGRPGRCDACMGLGLDVALGEDGRVLVADPDNRRWISMAATPEVTP